MIKLSSKQKTDFFRRCYTAVDGLWFVKAEERLGKKKALEIDKEVWKVMPKIQARALKSLGKQETGLAALADCFTAKLDLEGFRYRIRKSKNHLVVMLTYCPWHDILVKTKREHLSKSISEMICRTEYGVWAKEFGPGISFALPQKLCLGAKHCVLNFKKTAQ